MRSLTNPALVLVVLGVAAPALAQSAPRKTTPPAAGKAPAQDATCDEHGVKKSICSRCNPKLAAVYKAKGDWCQEHDRAESQCAICNPELKKKGVKP